MCIRDRVVPFRPDVSYFVVDTSLETLRMLVLHGSPAYFCQSDDAAELEAFKKRKYQYMAKDREGRDVFLADSGYVLQIAQMDFKHIKFHFTSEF